MAEMRGKEPKGVLLRPVAPAHKDNRPRETSRPPTEEQKRHIVNRILYGTPKGTARDTSQTE